MTAMKNIIDIPFDSISIEFVATNHPSIFEAKVSYLQGQDVMIVSPAKSISPRSGDNLVLSGIKGTTKAILTD